MFGSVRLLLALMVVLTHLVGSEHFHHFGYYAVRAFFVLSGYCITASLNEQYAFRAMPFWVNRSLKLLPTYYLVCLGTAAAVFAFPVQASEFLHFWDGGPTWSSTLLNLVVLPLQTTEPHFRFVPPVWSVAVEVVMYLLLWAFAARSWQGALIMFTAGLTYHAACIIDDLPWSVRYFLAPSGLLSFSLGSLIYFGLKSGLAHRVGQLAPYAAAGWIANLVVAMWAPGDLYDFGPGYYLNTVLFAVVVAKLATLVGSSSIQKLDRMLGDLAYPVFLGHWLAAFLVHLAIMPDATRGPGLALCATVCVLLMGSGFAILNRALVEPLRATIRKDAQSSEQGHNELGLPVARAA